MADQPGGTASTDHLGPSRAFLAIGGECDLGFCGVSGQWMGELVGVGSGSRRGGGGVVSVRVRHDWTDGHGGSGPSG